jgi:thiosulfate reductase cytochrome b subunit
MPRHDLVVRITHWLNALGTVALIVSGLAILLAHPRLYWGETGAVGGPSLIDLPIPFVFGHSGWGRYLHFLAAWVCVFSGTLYLLSGVATRHFRRALLSSRSLVYTPLQRLTYAVMVFVVAPLVLLSGLAFSPMLASISPRLVAIWGGQQSARTIHFFAAAAVVVFLIGHVVMVSVSGFRARMRSMIVGGPASMTDPL